jgi:hypothetical protein
MLLSLPTIQEGAYTPLPLGEEAPAPTSNGPKRIVNLPCLFLLLPIKIGESLIKT